MDENKPFQWPECPPYPAPSWFELTGAELGLEPNQVRFAAALITLGGPDSKNNSPAAELAGLDLNRTQAFRLARSERVRKLIDQAEQIKSGKRRPLTEEEIDARVDRMCISPNDRDAAVGIKLRDDRLAARTSESGEESPESLIFDVITTLPMQGIGPLFSMCAFHKATGNVFNFPFIDLTAPAVKKYFPDTWQKWVDAAGPNWRSFLDQVAAGNVLEDDALVAAMKAATSRKAETSDA